MRGSLRATLIKFGVFAVVMAVLTVFLFFIFGQYRTGATTGYSAVFNDASRLRTGDSVRVAGIRVGTVNGISLQPDKKVVVKFDADRSVVLTDGTKAAVRYLNLVGDRYLDLVDGPGSTKRLAAGGQIRVDHTAPALDLDLLLGGLKPVIQGLNPTMSTRSRLHCCRYSRARAAPCSRCSPRQRHSRIRWPTTTKRSSD